MRASSELILREIAGEHILVPVGKAALRIHGMIRLSESAAFLFGKLHNDCTEEELTDVLLAEYDVDRDTAAGDVHNFVEQMAKIGLLWQKGVS